MIENRATSFICAITLATAAAWDVARHVGGGAPRESRMTVGIAC